MTPVIQEIMPTDKCKLIKLKKLLQRMEAVNPVDTAYRMKKIFVIYISDRRLVSRIYKEQRSLSKKYNNLANEMYRQFYSTRQHRNANQNHT